jgi:hypothetical protein
MCDLTLMADDARIYDLHYGVSSVPGDGIHNAFEELLGVKRAAYALLTGEAIDARTALEHAMVNEILPREELIPRAYTISDHIMSQPRTVRRLTTQIIRRPWKKRILDDLDGGFGIQMFGHLAKGRAVHSDARISASDDARGSGQGVVPAELRLEHVHCLEEGGLLARREPAEHPGKRAGGAVEPLLGQVPLGRMHLDERLAAVGRVGLPVDEPGTVKVGEHAADRGQRQAEAGGDLAHGDRPAAELLQRGRVPRPERCAGAWHDAVLPAPHPP